jgi:hypothetical protein
MRQVACVVAGDRTNHPLPNQTRVTIDFSGNFHSRKMAANQSVEAILQTYLPKKSRCTAAADIPHWLDCTNFGHPLVDGLHSIACKRDKSRHFLLTIKMKGVKTTSFFDTF